MTAEPPPIRQAGAPRPQDADTPGPEVPSAPASSTERPGADAPATTHASDAAEAAPPTSDPACGVPRDQARAAKASLRHELAGDPEIRGVGLCREEDGGYTLVVNVSTTEARARVPGLVEGTPVRTRITREIYALTEVPGTDAAPDAR